MHGIHDTDQTTTGEDDDGFDPREAVTLLDQSRRDARRQFDLRPPLATAIGGVLILVAYGALWLSVRGQHPYSGPSLGVIALVYSMVAVSGVAAKLYYQRATAGISGPSVTQQKVEGAAILVSYLGSPVLQGALNHYGAGPALVYGVVPAAAPLIIVGTTVLGIAASKADWPQFGAALAVVIGGFVAAFVGPIGAWAVAGLGLSIGVVAYAVATAKLGRASERR